MAITRSRRLDDLVEVKREDSGAKVLRRPRKIKKEGPVLLLSLNRSIELSKLQSLKQREDIIRFLTTLRPQFKKIDNKFKIDKTRFAKSQLVTYKKKEGHGKINDSLKNCLARFNLQLLKNVINENQNLSIINCKQNISEVRQFELLEDHYSNLSLERQKLLVTFNELYNYKPKIEDILRDIKKLPNFNKQAVSKKKYGKTRTDNKKLQDIRQDNIEKKYPLTIPNLYKDLSILEVTKLKQEQLLKTCQIYDLRLKNIQYESAKFDLNDIKINEDEIYPMDNIYLRNNEDSDDEEQSQLNDFNFILEGLQEDDYLKERNFDEKMLKL